VQNNPLVSCPGDFVRANSAGWIGVGPAERFCGLGIEANVSAEFSSQIGDGSEDAAADHIALDFGEPEFDLMEPRRIGWGEVKAYLRMFGQEELHLFGLVSRKIIENDVNLLMRCTAGDDLFEEVDELRAGVPRGRLALHLPGLHLERRVQRQGAIASILEAMPLQACCGGFIYSTPCAVPR